MSVENTSKTQKPDPLSAEYGSGDAQSVGMHLTEGGLGEGLFAHLPDPVVIYDAQTNYFLDVNQKAIKRYGYTHQEWLAMKPVDIHPPYEAAVIMHRIQEASSARLNVYSHVCKDGEIIKVEINSEKIDYRGRAAWLVVIREISNRQAAEQVLSESDRILNVVFNASPVGTGLVRDGIIRWTNPSLRELLGYGGEELIERPIGEIYATKEDCHKAEKELYHGENENITSAAALKVRHKNGSVLDCVIRTSPLTAGGEDQVHLFTCENVTDLRKAEALLKEVQEGNRVVVENALEAILLCRRGRIVFCNPRLPEFTGRPVDDLVGGRLLDMVHPADRLVFEQELSRAGTEGVRNLRLRMLDSDGGVKWVELSQAEIVWENEPAVLSFISDITDTVISEKQKKLYEQRLRQSQKMEAIGSLTGGIAHDFNNMLGAIVGYAELAQLTGQDSGDVGYSLEQILKVTLRARRLIKQMLSFSRMEEQAVAEVILTPIIKEALRLMRATLPANIEITHDLSVTDAAVMGDPAQIHQMLINLCTNSAQAMSGAGGAIHLRLEQIVLDDNQAANFPELGPGDYLRLSVLDTGPGISPEILPRVFEPFFSTREKGKNSGMGA